jgi:hypothetical protein
MTNYMSMSIVIVEKIQTGFMNIKNGTVKDLSWQSCARRNFSWVLM